MDEIQSQRQAARERGIPESVIELWLGLARPQLVFSRIEDHNGAADAQTAGRYGGHPALPADVDWDGYPDFTAEIDCAALPPDLPGFPLPKHGTLLLFGSKEEPFDYSDAEAERRGRVLYIPAGTPTSERIPPSSPDYPDYYCVPFLLRCTQHWTLPDSEDPTVFLNEEYSALFEQYDLNSLMTDSAGAGVLSLAGHGIAVQDHPCLSYSDEQRCGSSNWRLLAESTATLGPHGFDGSFFWSIPAEDLNARRFDRVMFDTQMHDSRGTFTIAGQSLPTT